MSVAVVTGSGGLIGSEVVRFFHDKGFDVVGLDNDMRAYFFGDEASTIWNSGRLSTELDRYTHFDIDIRDQSAVFNLFKRYGSAIEIVIHTAAQPSHDWAATEPFTDFSVNATGTLVLLQATRDFCPDASFIFTSTNKVYGDTPNRLPLVELESRWELDVSHPYAEHGIDESLSIDETKHSLFGASKLAADILVQEYGRYFDMKTVCFRGGCITGPAHSGAELHGFLAYLIKCAIIGRRYSIFGYKGKQVRDNIHAYDLVNSFWQFHLNPKPAAIYNLGGSRYSNCSVLEAFQLVSDLGGYEANFVVLDNERIGDHIWWISDVRRFQQDYPNWKFKYDLKTMVSEIIEAIEDRA